MRRTRSSSVEATGSPIISDGEQRWSSFATYPITDTLAGTGLADNLAPTAASSSRSSPTATTASCPRLTGGPFRYKTYAADTLAKSIALRAQADEAGGHRAVDARAAVPARRTRSPATRASEFEEDLVDECEKDIRQAFEAGAARVSIDFTEGRLATRDDPRNPWTGRGHAAALHRAEQPGDRPLHRRRSARNIGIHTCPGGDRDSVHSADVPYSDLLPQHVRDQRRLLPHPAGQRARQGPGATSRSASTAATTPTAWRRCATSA